MLPLVSYAIASLVLSNQVALGPDKPASCTIDRQPAKIARIVHPDYPQIAELQRVGGTARIRVDLSDDGSVRGSYVVVSSGNTFLDRSALQAASDMTYAPEQRACKAIAGSYALDFEFPG